MLRNIKVHSIISYTSIKFTAPCLRCTIMTDLTKSLIPMLPRARYHLDTREIQIRNSIEFQGICTNVPLPPQAYDSFNSLQSLKRNGRSSKITIKIPLEYPKPAIPHKYEYLYIGANKTLIPWQFYVNIPWYSYEIATSFLMEYTFEAGVLSTHNLHGKKQLDQLIVEDIVVHVCQRCNVSEENVLFVIAKLCADFAKLRKKGCLSMGLSDYQC